MSGNHPIRPMSGGTLDGLRPKNYSYWRVGYGNSENVPINFWIERAGEYHCEPPHIYPIFDYEVDRWTRITYITQGEAQWQTVDKIYHLNVGDLLILPPNHQGYYRSDVQHRFHWCALVGKWPSMWGGEPRLIHMTPGLDQTLESNFIAMRELLILGQVGHALLALSRFYAIFGRIQTLTVADKSSSPYPEAVRSALIYLDENCAEPFEAAKAAAKVHISPSHLRALFEKWVGESPKRYHTRCRINRAKQLLAQQGLSIQAISTQIGFNDLGYFSRVFKQSTGVSPSQYARQVQMGGRSDTTTPES